MEKEEISSRDGEVRVRKVRAEDRAFWFSLDRHLDPAMFDRKVRDGEGYVLTVGPEPVGILRYSLFWDSTPFCNLLYVAEGWRRAGLGRILMTRWEEDMRSLGHGSVMTSTQADEEAQHFYRKRGYLDCGGFLPEEGGPTELILIKRF